MTNYYLQLDRQLSSTLINFELFQSLLIKK